MSEEQATGSVESTSTETTSSESVNQNDYVSDAMARYLTGKSAVEPSLKTKAETPKEDTGVPPKAETPKEPETKQDEKKPELDPIDQVFRTDKGEFDANGFLSFTLPEDTKWADDDKKPVVPGSKQQQPADTRPEWQRELEEAEKYKTSMYSAAVDPLNEVWQLIQQGKDPQTALNEVFEKQKGVVDKHIKEWEYKRRFESEEKRQKSAAEQERAAKIAERAKINVSSVISKLPGKDDKEKTSLFSHIMFNPEIGAYILNREFAKRYPDVSGMSEEEKGKLAEKFVMEVQSDKEEFKYIFNLAMDRAHRLKSKQTAQINRMLGERQAEEKRSSAQKHPAGPYNRQPSGAEKDPWGLYFAGNLGDRI
jgi:hypothetical protein